MSKIDELKQVYDAAEDAAQCVAIPGESFIDMMHRAQLAGIAAVVRALRDECDRVLPCDRKFSRNQVWDVFEEILGAAGDEVAGVLAVESREGAMISEAPEAPATAPAPVNVAKMQRTLLRKWRKTHSNPAPAVCEWVDVGDKYRSACGRSHFAWTSRDGVVVCPECKAPIKFTEAKT